jgi:hypothetical protein
VSAAAVEVVSLAPGEIITIWDWPELGIKHIAKVVGYSYSPKYGPCVDVLVDEPVDKAHTRMLTVLTSIAQLKVSGQTFAPFPSRTSSTPGNNSEKSSDARSYSAAETGNATSGESSKSSTVVVRMTTLKATR